MIAVFANACEDALSQLGPAAVPALTAALSDPQYKARGRVVAILAQRRPRVPRISSRSLPGP